MLSTLVSVVLLLYFGHHFADAIVPISAGSPFKSNGSAANVLVVFYTEVCSFFLEKKIFHSEPNVDDVHASLHQLVVHIMFLDWMDSHACK